jgi:hypothetical protein
MEPHEFRRHYNSFLQAARSTVLLTERQKRHIPDGQTTLAAWQDANKANPIYRWGTDSRDQVVHETDLALHSVAVIEYRNGATHFALDRYNVTPEISNAELLSAMLMARPEALRSGTLSVERKWIDADLPGVELLDAGARLYELLLDLMRAIHGGAQCALELPPRDCTKRSLGSPACMRSISSATSLVLDLATRASIVGKARAWEASEDWNPEVARERYGSLIDVGGDPIRAAMAHMKRASLFLVSDTEALPFATLYHGEAPVEKLMVAVQTPSMRAGFFRHMGERIRAMEADGFIMTSEVWTNHRATAKPVATHDDTFYDIDPFRDEALLVVAATADGRRVMFRREFTRDEKGVAILSDRIDRLFSLPEEYAPVLEALTAPKVVYKRMRSNKRTKQ